MVPRVMLAFARRHPLWTQAAIALIAAFVTRAWQFGNPVIQIDEQFYLLTGERMLHGALPFVDIWDRKPIGIFVIYAAIRLLGGDGVLQYQIVATLFAGGTAFLIAWMALRFTGPRGAALAGIAYLLWLLIFDGSGGQTPVFYNALVAGGAALTLLATAPGAGSGRLVALGGAAMLSVGLALQIKYSAVFEGIFFGLVLLWRAGALRGIAGALAAAPFWIALALLPTAAAFAWYAQIGQDSAFLYANFVSIFDRGSWPAAKLVGRIAEMVGMAFPLLLCAWLEWRAPEARRPGMQGHARRFALGWLASALIGLIVFGTYYTHYFLPVLVPLTLVCARLLDDVRNGLGAFDGVRERRISFGAFLGLTALALIAITAPKRLKSRGNGEAVRAVAAVVRANLDGCLFVFDGEPILYHLTDACTVTSRIFPNHLNDAIEADAVGVDPAAEIARILADPRTDIVIASDRPDPKFNAETLPLLRAGLAKHFRPIFRLKSGSRDRIVYKRIVG